MKNKFDDMENYTVIANIVPDTYGYINITSVVGLNNSSKTYRLRRSMKYDESFSALRDRMFAGNTVMYAKIGDLLGDNAPNSGELKNYYLIAIESGNDLPKRTLSFDMYILQADSFKILRTMPKFLNLPGVSDTSKHIAVFTYGYQRVDNMNLIDIENKVFHTKAFRHDLTSIRSYTLDEPLKFDLDNDICKKFIDSCFYGTDRFEYDIGIIMEPYEHKVSHTDTPNNVKDAIINTHTTSSEDINMNENTDNNQNVNNASAPEPQSEAQSKRVDEQGLTIMDIGDILGNSTTVKQI